MRSVNLDDQGGGKAAIFYGNKRWKRVPSESSPDGEAQWLDTTGDRRANVDNKMARLLEHAYRHPEKASKMRRFPRLPAEVLADKAKAGLLADLETKAFHWIARGHQANIELGFVFNQIKALLKHGKWKRYFAETFVPRGIRLRTATEYMRLAREHDEITKKADSALFPLAADAQAIEVNSAGEEAEQEVANATVEEPESAESQSGPSKTRLRKSRPRVDGVYRVPLFLTGKQKDNLDALRNSEDWADAALEITATIERLFIRYGLVDPGESS